MDNSSKTLKDLVNNTKIVHNETQFRVPDRINTWKKQAAYYFDDDLDKLKTAMIKVFKEEDPQYNIDASLRIFTDNQKEKTIYSEDLREGLAVTLALIGIYHALLTNCSYNRRINFVEEVMQDIFSGMTWKRLATLDNVLPFFAEANPDVFLLEMGKLVENKSLFTQLLDDEGGLWEGGFHWRGIVDALATLAWEQDYLIRVIDLLIKLSSLDKETNRHPRPKDMLCEIFWIWKPQTCAEISKITAAARILINCQHQLGWNVLKRAISAPFNTPHRKPLIRKVFPDDFVDEPNQDRGIKLSKEYKMLMLEAAAADINLLDLLSNQLYSFTAPVFWATALKILSSQSVQNCSDEIKEPIWKNLRKFCIKNRKNKNASRDQDENRLTEVEKVIALLQPKSLLFQSKYLFEKGIWDWFEDGDYNTAEKKFQTQQVTAVKKIFDQLGKDGFADFVELVDRSFSVGFAVGSAGIEFSKSDIASMLAASSSKMQEFLCGYLTFRYSKERDIWLDSFADTHWNNTQKVDFLCHLPFAIPVLRFCEKWLAENERLYWLKCNFPTFPIEKDDYGFAVEKALKYDRPDIAVECVYWNYDNKIPVDFNICANALSKLASSELVKNVESWEILQLIAYLQKQIQDDAQRKVLMQLEFSYFPLFDSNVSEDIFPVTLGTALATDPDFFYQIISYAYQSRDDGDVTIANTQAVRNAFQLLHQWKIMPGVVDNKLDYDIFFEWYSAVIKLCGESRLCNVCQLHIGNILIYTPPDPSGLWIDKRIAALLDKVENAEILYGYILATYNSRGVHAIDMSGQEDLELAKKYKEKASDLEDNGFLNFAQGVRYLVSSYEQEAEKWQKESERLKVPNEL